MQTPALCDQEVSTEESKPTCRDASCPGTCRLKDAQVPKGSGPNFWNWPHPRVKPWRASPRSQCLGAELQSPTQVFLALGLAFSRHQPAPPPPNLAQT